MDVCLFVCSLCTFYKSHTCFDKTDTGNGNKMRVQFIKRACEQENVHLF